MEDNKYKVIVPSRSRTVSYPPSNKNGYTRAEAIAVLKIFHSRFHWEEGDELEAYAESPTERFTLHFPENLLK